jgi:arabinofuranosyltransferase
MVFIKRYADWLSALALLAVVFFYAARYVNFNMPPFEDAAMLMRYADHLAHGYGIVWNIGQHPVDGATDFLFMAASAALIRIGLPVGRSVRAIGFVSHILTVLLVYWVNRKIWKANVVISFVTALYLAVGTGLSYVAAFFGTPLFAFLAALTWTFGLLLIQTENPSFWLSLLFALAGLLTGLTRPEGVILAGLMLVAVIVMKGWRHSAKAIFVFAAVFSILGGAYFLWRWNYFGYPLPNPFYVKSGGILHSDSFWESFSYLFRFSGPFALAFLLGFRSKKTIRLTIAFLIPLVVFASAFILIDNQTNFGGRFQYALWPLVLLSWYPLVEGIEREVGFSWPQPPHVWERGVWILAALAIVYGVVRYSASQNCLLAGAPPLCNNAYSADGRYNMAQMLSKYQGRGYVIATSEAGLLPFYSNWTAIDTWGLNDEWIAHHGGITAQYLDQYRPDVIVFHAYFSPLVPPKLIPKNLSQDWFRMTITLMDYARSRGYILAAAFGDSPYETHYYYVRPDFPDSARIVRDISTMKNYYWPGTGRKSINYAQVQP